MNFLQGISDTYKRHEPTLKPWFDFATKTIPSVVSEADDILESSLKQDIPSKASTCIDIIRATPYAITASLIPHPYNKLFAAAGLVYIATSEKLSSSPRAIAMTNSIAIAYLGLTALSLCNMTVVETICNAALFGGYIFLGNRALEAQKQAQLQAKLEKAQAEAKLANSQAVSKINSDSSEPRRSSDPSVSTPYTGRKLETSPPFSSSSGSSKKAE